jgi:hypothetical protein
MKYSAILSIFLLFAYGCGNAVQTKLLNEQKTLKDSANNVRDRIGGCVQKGVYDSADVKKKQLGAIHARLTAIQYSLDSLEKNTK